jgi:crossover junction endonuclease MUS81
MILTIIIDSRETSLFSILSERDLDIYKDKIVIEKKQLDIGDIHIIFNNNCYIYERKTINDLLASIKDGRYKEQKHRLKASSANSINYIIEGDTITSAKNDKNQKMLTSTYYHSIYRDNINVFFTINTNETATFLLLLATKIIDKPENFINNNNEKNDDYIDICKIKTQKNKNITKETCYLLQLSQIPGISKEIARNINEIYPSFASLLKALHESDDKISLLMNIKLIGKTKATTIIEYLL